MISFEVAGSEIIVRFTLGYPVSAFGLTGRVNAGTQLAATLLREHLDERLAKSVRRARELAYAEGWKDAKAKRARTEFFSGVLDGAS